MKQTRVDLSVKAQNESLILSLLMKNIIRVKIKANTKELVNNFIIYTFYQI